MNELLLAACKTDNDVVLDQLSLEDRAQLAANSNLYLHTAVSAGSGKIVRKLLEDENVMRNERENNFPVLKVALNYEQLAMANFIAEYLISRKELDDNHKYVRLVHEAVKADKLQSINATKFLAICKTKDTELMSKFIANNLRDLSQHENVILNIVVESNNIVAVQLLLEDKAVCSTEIKNLFPALRIALSEGFLACAKIMISKFMEMIGRLGTDEFRILLTLKMSLEIKERAQLEAVVGRHARASTRSIDASSPGHPLTSMKSHISRSPRNSSKSVDLAVLNEEITQPQLLAQIPDASEPESKPEPHSRRKRFFCLCI